VKKLLATIVLIAACLTLTGCLLPPRTEKPAASNTQTPASGSTTAESPDRAAVLAALLPAIEAKLGQPAALRPERVTIENGWAFVDGQTVQPDGNPIDYSKTPYKEAVAAGAFDDGFSALLRLEGGAWKVLTFNIGATDVPWVEWPNEFGAPKTILPSP
jgi:hypothetical protein